MTVDTNPDRARLIEVDLEGDPSEIDVDSIQIYAWLSTSTTTSRTLLVPTDPDGSGYHASHALSASNNYVRVSVAARAVRDDGTPLDNIRVRVRE